MNCRLLQLSWSDAVSSPHYATPAIVGLTVRLPFGRSLVPVPLAQSFSLDGRTSGPPRAPAEWALFLCGIARQMPAIQRGLIVKGRPSW